MEDLRQNEQSLTDRAVATARRGAALVMGSVALVAAGGSGSEASAESGLTFNSVGVNSMPTLEAAESTAASDPQLVYDCEIAVINSFNGGQETPVRNRSGKINSRYIRQQVSMRDSRTVNEDGNLESCVGVVKGTLRVGEFIHLKHGGSGMNTPVDASHKPVAVYYGLGPVTVNRKQHRAIIPKRGDRLRQFVEIDVSPVSDPSQVYGKVIKGPPVTVR